MKDPFTQQVYVEYIYSTVGWALFNVIILRSLHIGIRECDICIFRLPIDVQLNKTTWG